MKHKTSVFLLITIAILFLVSCQSGKNVEINSDPSISATSSPTPPPTNTSTPKPAPVPKKIGEFGKDGASELLWSPDGKYLAVRTSDEVDLINTQTWEVETSLDISSYDSMETQMYFEPQGTILYLVIERDYRRDIWQYDTTNTDKKRFGKWKMDLKHSFGSLFYLSPSNKYLAIAEGTELEIMDLENNSSRDIQILDTWGFENDPNIAVFNASESQIALGMQNNIIKIINPDSGRIQFTLQHDSHINDITYSPNEKLLVSASNDATVKFWDAKTGKLLSTLNDFRYGIGVVRYFDNGSRLLVGEEDTNKIYIYQVDKQFLPVELEKTTAIAEGSSIYTFEFKPETMEIALLQGGTVEIWDLNSGSRQKVLPEYGSGHGIALISPDSQQLAVVNSNIHLFDIPEHKWIAALPVVSGSADAAVYSPAQNVIAVASGKTIYLWNTDTLEKILEIPMSIEGQIMAFSQDGSMLAAAGFDQIVVFDAANGETILKIDLEFTSPYHLCFSEDNTLLYFISGDERAAWKISYGEKLYGIPAEIGGRMSVALSPDLGLIVETIYTENSNSLYTIYSFYEPLTGEIKYAYTIDDVNHQPSVSMDPSGSLLIIQPGEGWLFYTDTKNAEVLFRKTRNLDYGFSFSPKSDILFYKPNFGDYIFLEDISSFMDYVKDSEVGIFPPVITPTPMPTEKSAPEIPEETPVGAVQLPEVAQVIEPENITSLKLLNELSTSRTYASAWSNDGQLLAIANDKGVEIINVETHKTISHIAAIQSLDELIFSPDNQYLAMRAYLAESKVFDITTGKEIFSNSDEMCRDQHIIFGEDGNILTLYCEANSYKWDLNSGKLLSTNNGIYLENSATGNNSNLAVIKEDSSVRLINFTTNKSIHTFDIPNYLPIVSDISPDGNYMFVWFYEYDTNNREGIPYPLVESDSILQLWEIDEEQNLKLYNSINIDTQAFPSISFSADGKLLFTNVGDGQTRVFKVPSGQLLTTFEELYGYSFSPNGKWLYAESMPEAIWDISNSTKPTIAWNRTQFKNTNIFLSITNNNEMVTLDGNIFNFWEIDKADVIGPMLTITARDKDIVTAAVSPDGNWLAYISYENAVVGKRNGKFVNWFTIRTYEPMEKEYFYDCTMMFSPDSSMIVVKDMYYDLDLWHLDNLSAGSIEFEPAKDYYLSNYLFSPDSKYIIGDFQHGYGSTASLYLWDIETREEIHKWKNTLAAYTMHPKENTFVELWGNRIVFRDLTNTELENRIDYEPYGYQFELHYHPDGNIISLLQNDGIHFIDGSTGIDLRIIAGNFEDFHFTPDGKYLITISRNNQIKIWGIAE